MSITRVAVLRGGPSDEYDVSLKSGAAVLEALGHDTFADTYHTADILIARDGTWHIAGVPVEPHQIFGHADVFVNALHGTYGEDGKLQAIFDEHGVAYTGSRTLASAVGMNKALSKKVFRQHGIKTPNHLVIERTSFDPAEIYQKFSLPLVVKPTAGGSSLGISIVKDFKNLHAAVIEAFNYANEVGTVLIEEFIPGREATVGVIDRFRGEEIYALPAIEIRHKKEFFDYEAKYGDAETVGTEEIVPGNFSRDEKVTMESMARDIHRALGLRHYSRSDFIVTPRRGIYAIEVNTLPGLAPACLLPKALVAVGSNLPDFLDHIVRLALDGK